MMLKFALLATAIAFSAPVLPQTQTTPSNSQAGRTPMTDTAPTTATAPTTTGQTAQMQAAPAQTNPATDPAQTASQPTTQTSPASPQTTDPAVASQPATGQAASGQAASGSQVAQVVDTEFPTYDKDKNGALSETEFASWMVALKTASDPATKAESAETKAWVNGAFAQADKDKSKTVSKAELTGFLSQGQS